MGERTKKALEFVKEHKVEILVITGGVVLGCLGIRHLQKKETEMLGDLILETTNTVWPDDITKNVCWDGAVGCVDDILKYPNNGAIELWLDRMQLQDLGKLGEDILTRIPDVPENHKVWALLSINEITE